MKVDANTIQKLLESLAKTRRAFCSEMDFQLHFAWLLKEHGFDVSLEHDPGCFERNASIDIMIWTPERVAIELKYKTVRFEVDVGGHPLSLKNHGAQDIGRYDFFKDIFRIEKVVNAKQADKGFAIFLTNDASYWGIGRNATADEMFRMFEGRTVIKGGPYQWGIKTGAGTMKGREKSITLVRDHTFNWKNYTDFGTKYGLFRYLMVDVERETLSVVNVSTDKTA